MVGLRLNFDPDPELSQPVSQSASQPLTAPPRPPAWQRSPPGRPAPRVRSAQHGAARGAARSHGPHCRAGRRLQSVSQSVSRMQPGTDSQVSKVGPGEAPLNCFVLPNRNVAVCFCTPRSAPVVPQHTSAFTHEHTHRGHTQAAQGSNTHTHLRWRRRVS